MNNLSLYCGLVDKKIRASDKDLPVCIEIGAFTINVLRISTLCSNWIKKKCTDQGSHIFVKMSYR